MYKKEHIKGFSFLELLAVLIILSALTALIVPTFTNRKFQSKEVAHNTNFYLLLTQGKLYAIDNPKARGDITQSLIYNRYVDNIPTNPLYPNDQTMQYKVVINSTGDIIVTPPATNYTYPIRNPDNSNNDNSSNNNNNNDNNSGNNNNDTDNNSNNDNDDNDNDNNIIKQFINKITANNWINSQSIIQTNDGGYLVSGKTNASNNGDIPKTNGEYDGIYYKINKKGNKEWIKTIGGDKDDYIFDIAQTNDHYYMCGYTASNNNDISYNRGNDDALIIKTDVNGNKIWSKTFGGARDDEFRKISINKNNHIYAIGNTRSEDGHFHHNEGKTDWVIMKLDLDGNIIWTKTLGTDESDIATGLITTDDGGCLVAGYGENGSDFGTTHGDKEIILVKLNEQGETTWKQTYGGSDNDYISDIIQTNDGGYVFCGTTESYNYDFYSPRENQKSYIMKVNNSGSIEWNKIYNSSKSSYLLSLTQLKDNDLIITGYRYSNDIDLKDLDDNTNSIIIKLSSDGISKWIKNIKKDADNHIYSVTSTSDGGFITTGYYNDDSSSTTIYNSITVKFDKDGNYK